jgi:hypothetical protein
MRERAEERPESEERGEESGWMSRARRKETPKTPIPSLPPSPPLLTSPLALLDLLTPSTLALLARWGVDMTHTHTLSLSLSLALSLSPSSRLVSSSHLAYLDR